MAKVYSAGIATAYGAAKRGGYTGTYQDFCREQAGFAENAQQVAEDRAAVETLAVQFENTIVPQAITEVQQEAVTQVHNVNTTGAAQVQRVQEEGTAQVGRVQIAVAEQMDRAELAANNALTSERNAADSASAASESEANAEASKTAAAQSAAQAQETVDGAISAINTTKEAALAAVESAEDDAVQAVQTEGATQTARAKAQADAAVLSATNAAGSATTASTKAGEAADSATAAADSASDAESDKDAAEAAQAAAEAAAQSVSESAAQIAQNTEDIAGLKADQYTAYATDTASGAIASFPDGADNIPVKDLSVAIEPVQAGTGDPSPDNIRPISGWTGAEVTRTGKNLLRYPYYDSTKTGNGLTVTDNGDGTLTANGTTTATLFFNLYRNTADDCLRLKAGTYRIPAIGNTTNLSFNWYFVGGSSISTGSAERTFTLENDSDVYCFLRFEANVTFSNVVVSPMLLAAPETDLAYESYHGNTYSITFPSEAGTVYGGTLDVTKGKLTVDRAMVDAGTLQWSKDSSGTLYAPWPQKKAGSLKMTCSALATLDSSFSFSNYAGYPDNVIGGNTNATNQYFYAKATAYATAADFKTAMSGVQLCYEIKTPVIYDLTPTEVRTLLGTNNIWADCGDSTVEYRADTKLYIDKKIAALAAAMN